MKIHSLLLGLLCLYGLSACSTLSKSDDISTQTLNDPYENFNRKVYGFNATADKYILKPITKTYDAALPKPAKKGVSNFLNNLGEPLNLINNALQGKLDGALSSTYRFIVNSTIGVFGLFDIAKKHDVKLANEDFGQTLGSWGVKPGPYLVLPFLGPSNVRDGIGRIGDFVIFNSFDEFTNSNDQKTALTLINIIDIRYKLLNLDSILESQIDPYSFVRTGYQQNRINVLYDGNPPEADSEDFNDF